MKSRECIECGEDHLLRADGRMSIHITADGARCEEPEPPRHPAPAERRTRGRTYGDREKDIAHEYAATQRGRNRGPDDRPDPGLDRRIYATEGATFVRGGAPGSKRSH